MVPRVSEAVSDTLEIHVNRERPNVLEVPDTFETSTAFSVEIVNDGKPVHLHLNYDDDLAAGLSMETGNHFIPRDNVYRLPVHVEPDARPFHGKFQVSIGYGAEKRFIEIRVPEPEVDTEVRVDAELAEPSGRPRPPPTTDRVIDLGILALLGVALLALVAGALIVATLVTPLAGALLVIVALLLAAGVYVVVAEA